MNSSVPYMLNLLYKAGANGEQIMEFADGLLNDDPQLVMDVVSEIQADLWTRPSLAEALFELGVAEGVIR